MHRVLQIYIYTFFSFYIRYWSRSQEYGVVIVWSHSLTRGSRGEENCLSQVERNISRPPDSPVGSGCLYLLHLFRRDLLVGKFSLDSIRHRLLLTEAALTGSTSCGARGEHALVHTQNTLAYAYHYAFKIHDPYAYWRAAPTFQPAHLRRVNLQVISSRSNLMRNHQRQTKTVVY